MNSFAFPSSIFHLQHRAHPRSHIHLQSTLHRKLRNTRVSVHRIRLFQVEKWLFLLTVRFSSFVSTGFKRGRDPTDDFALQLGQLAAPKLPTGVGGGYGSGYGDAGIMSNGAGTGFSPDNNNDT